MKKTTILILFFFILIGCENSTMVLDKNYNPDTSRKDFRVLIKDGIITYEDYDYILSYILKYPFDQVHLQRVKYRDILDTIIYAQNMYDKGETPYIPKGYDKEFMNKIKSIVKNQNFANTNYTLNNIEFDKNHKIVGFNMSEVADLARELRTHKTGKIEVRVYTNEGVNSKENENFSKIRAKRVAQMLETFGVSKKRLSFKGMGYSSADIVQIQVK